MILQNTSFTSASILLLLNPVITLTARAEIYMTGEEAAKVFFPGQIFKKHNIELSDEEKNQIQKLSDTQLKSKYTTLLLSGEGNVVFLDQVIGKHEQISFAVGITKEAKVKGIEILEYRESYGHQVRREEWRKQFVGKDKSSTLKNNQDIKNISGATLSSNHITDGVRRILQTYELIKKRL